MYPAILIYFIPVAAIIVEKKRNIHCEKKTSNNFHNLITLTVFGTLPYTKT
jgi:hypothetical protein